MSRQTGAARLKHKINLIYTQILSTAILSAVHIVNRADAQAIIALNWRTGMPQMYRVTGKENGPKTPGKAKHVEVFFEALFVYSFIRMIQAA